MKTTWVLVAENSRARLFDWQSKTSLNEIKTLSHPESRLHEQDLVSDEPGRSFDSAGNGRHAEQAPTSAKQHESQTFARELAATLEQSRSNNEFDHLIIVAAPHFLGLLRDEINGALRKTVLQELDKNLARQSAADILKHLPDTMPV